MACPRRTAGPRLSWCLSAKELTLITGVIVACLAVFAYVALPGLAIRGYRSSTLRELFERGQPSLTWADRVGVPILTVVMLEAFFVLALQVLIFFGGLFPLLSTWTTGCPDLL